MKNRAMTTMAGVAAMAVTLAGTTAAWGQAETGFDLEGVDVAAIASGETGARIFVRGFANGVVEHNIYTSDAGYSGWSDVPGDAPCIDGLGELEDVQVIVFDQPAGARLYMRAFSSGVVQQNIFTAAGGYAGWQDLPHEGRIDLVSDSVTSADCVALNGLYGPRLFVRLKDSGLVEQCVYTPGDGYLGWTEVPAMDLPFGSGASSLGSNEPEAVAVTAYGALYDTRIFVVGLENRKVYQNVYGARTGYQGWSRVRNFNPTTAGDNELSGVDVLRLDDPPGAIIYARGRENGRVDQNVFTPQTGFSGWNRVPNATSALGDDDLADCAVTAFDGLFGPRVFVRAFEDGHVEQNVYTPGAGYSGWTEVPDPNDG